MRFDKVSARELDTSIHVEDFGRPHIDTRPGKHWCWPEHRSLAEIDSLDATKPLRGGEAASRLAHNQKIAGASPAPATKSHTGARLPAAGRSDREPPSRSLAEQGRRRGPLAAPADSFDPSRAADPVTSVRQASKSPSGQRSDAERRASCTRLQPGRGTANLAGAAATVSDRELIDRFIAEHGVTVCPPAYCARVTGADPLHGLPFDAAGDAWRRKHLNYLQSLGRSCGGPGKLSRARKATLAAATTLHIGG